MIYLFWIKRTTVAIIAFLSHQLMMVGSNRSHLLPTVTKLITQDLIFRKFNRLNKFKYSNIMEELNNFPSISNFRARISQKDPTHPLLFLMIVKLGHSLNKCLSKTLFESQNPL